MNVSAMSREQQGDGNQEEQLMGYLKNVVLLKLNYYEGLIEAGFLLDLSLWSACLLKQTSTESTDTNTRRMSRLQASSMLPIIFYGVIEYL